MKKLGFGCMRLPVTETGEPDYEQINQMVDLFMAKGFTYFDTARPYHNGLSEEAIGRCLASRYPRESFVLADKLTMHFFLTSSKTMEFVKSEDALETFFDSQRKACRVDFFDNYLLHNIGQLNYKRAKELHAFEFIRRMKAEGKARNIGFSFHDSPELLEDVLTVYPDMDYVQLQVNYTDWNSESIQSRKCCEVAERHGVPVIVMEPIKGGTLANLPEDAERLLKEYHPELSAASWAIRFAASQRGVACVLSGMSSLEQLADNISYMENFQPLDSGEYQVLKDVVEILNRSNAIGCTACGYCLNGCPKKINIPKIFALYNTDLQYTNEAFSPQAILYGNSFQHGNRAEDCIGCGQCEKACPQHLHVRDWLKEAARRFV